MNSPQAVTQRYISNLIHNGRNKEFDLEMVTMRENMVENTRVGVYFTVRILSKTSAENGVGATIQQAVQQGLERHGVTFR